MSTRVSSQNHPLRYYQKCEDTTRNRGFIACQFATILKRINNLFFNILMTINRYHSNHHRGGTSPLYFRAKNKEEIPPCYVAMIPLVGRSERLKKPQVADVPEGAGY